MSDTIRPDESTPDPRPARPPAPRRRPPVPGPRLAADASPAETSGWAVMAGYLGVASVACLPAPFAVACGVLALREITCNPRVRGAGRAWFGLVMGTVFTAAFVLGLAGLVLTVATDRGR